MRYLSLFVVVLMFFASVSILEAQGKSGDKGGKGGGGGGGGSADADTVGVADGDTVEVEVADGDTLGVAEEDTVGGGGKGRGGGKSGTITIRQSKIRVGVGKSKKIRATGGTGTLTWVSEDPDIGTIDSTGVFTAKTGGSTIVTVMDEGANRDSTEVVVMGGPTKFRVGRGARAFSKNDTLTLVNFPANARSRAFIALVEKRGEQNLPANAKGRGRIAVVYEFTATDDSTGEDVGESGFDEPVQITLHFKSLVK